MNEHSRKRAPRRLEWLSIPLLLGLWWLAAAVTQNDAVPSPVMVAVELWDQLTQGYLLQDFGRTLTRVAIAFVIAMALGSLIGALLGRFGTADALFASWIVIGLNVPAIVVAILCYILLGLTETALILAVVINKVPLVATTMREGVRNLSADYRELAVVYRLSLVRRLRLVQLPQLMPYLLTAARTGLSLIWKIVLVFEVLGSDGGVGFRIGIFFGFFDVTAILAYTVAFVCVVFAVELLVMRPLEQRILGWRPARD